jgi:hypothetical protein
MSLHALTRSILFATSLLAGLGQSVSALAHGVAHAHEAEHRVALAQPEAHAHEQHEHQGQHQEEPQTEPTWNSEGPQHASGNFEFTQPEHDHDHVHAIVDAGLKSRPDLIPSLVAQATALTQSVSVSVAHETPHAASPAPPPERRHTSASPRAPPSR